MALAKSQGLEGSLFPDTYAVTRATTPQDLVIHMTGNFRKVVAAMITPLAVRIPWNERQILTVASMVEKETGVDAERPIIAGIFYRRLSKGMPLQSDPTVIYGLKNFDGNIRKTDLQNPHPYNTYAHAGLPPGPICNPGLPSLRAAVQPAVTDYLYFVSKGDGTHHFSSTAQQHLEAVRQYQLK